MSTFDDKTVYILDSYGLIFRCYFAFISRPLTNPKGENVSALFGFFRNMHWILQHYKPGYIVAAMDSKTKTFRHEMYPEYKATRNKTPDDLHAQIPWICDVLKALGIPVLQCDGYEADDIIATVAKKCEAQGRTCRILSGDKDLMQLVTESTQILKPESGASTWKITGPEGVEAEWGVRPEKLLDLLSLYGDTADNVPGVKGIGPKTASQLLTSYGDLDGIYSHIEELKGATKQKLIDGRENAYFSQKLIRLCDTVPCPEIDDAINAPKYTFNYEAAAELLKQYGAFQVAKSYSDLGIENTPTVIASDSSVIASDSSVIASAAKQSTENVIASEAKQSTPSITQNDTSNYRALTKIEELEEYITSYLNNVIASANSVIASAAKQSTTNVIASAAKQSTENVIASAAKQSTTPQFPIAYDSETTSLDTFNCDILGFSLCYEKGHAVYIPLQQENSQDLFSQTDYISKEQAFKQLERIFNNSNVTIIMHNAKFDLKVLINNGFNLSSVIASASPVIASKTPVIASKTSVIASEAKQSTASIYDTMIAAWLQNPERLGKNGYSLEYLCETQVGLKGIEFDDIVQKGQTFADVPLETAYKYAAEDADFTLQLYQKQIENSPVIASASPVIASKTSVIASASPVIASEAKQSTSLFELEMRILPILTQMEINGIHIDSSKLNEYNTELTRNLALVEQNIYKEVGHDFNISSPKQLQTILFEERHLKPGKKTKTGYSTDTSVLEELAEFDPVPRMILEYRELAKLQSTYVQTLPSMADKNGRIHTDFVQTGTATGRLSCREPNLQNIPIRSEAGRKIREAFTAPQGKVLISADYAQIELVVLAHLSGDKNMCKSFIDGTDVHKATAAMIYGVAPEAVTPDMRRIAKTINFGVIYGMSAFSLAKDLGISRTQAQNFIEMYFKQYNSISDFMTNIISKAEETGYVETILGRRRPIMNINSRNKIEKSSAERMAKNTPIQGSAADIVKTAMIKVSDALKETASPARLLLQVHDELIFECPDDKDTIEKTIALIKDKMENAVNLSVPLRVSVEYGKSWGEFH